MVFRSLLLFFCFFILSQLRSQDDSEELRLYDNYMNEADALTDLNLYGEAIEQLNLAYDVALKNNWKERQLKSSIFLGELYRITKDFDNGLDLLLEQKYSIDFPKLHVNKLGRMAALYTEGARPKTLGDEDRRDTVLKYIDSALAIAIPINYIAAIPGLFNEKGFIYTDINGDSSIFYLKKAAEQFKINADSQNYIGAQTNLLRILYNKRDSSSMAKIIAETTPYFSSDQWYSTLSEFYRMRSAYYLLTGDTNKRNYWEMLHHKNAFNYQVTASSDKIKSYQALYETQKYRDKAEMAEEKLNLKDSQRRQLIITVSVLGILLCLIIFLLLREHGLKKEVDKANERYHMLLVESNHRIKNNLQMIISMLQFSNQNINEQESVMFRRISGKIHTISALHQHLYLDLHNEKVKLANYFEDIFTMYENISAKTFSVNKNMNSKIALGSEKIVYFGLILNEMISNTYEHSNAKEKEIFIRITKVDKSCQFEYWDNSNFSQDGVKGTGITLINQLITRVEGYDFKVDSTKGLYQFKFYA